MNNPMRALPPQPIDITPSVQNDWMLLRNQAFNTWVDLYFDTLRRRGFGVLVVEDTRGNVSEVYQTGAYVTIQIVREGITADVALTLNRAWGNDPETQANLDLQNIWNFNAAMAGLNSNTLPVWTTPQTGAPPVYPVSSQAPAPAPAPAPSSSRSETTGSRSGSSGTWSGGQSRTPGTSPTLPVGSTNINNLQSPPTPNPGTVITSPEPEPERMNWDQHNWFYEQETGRPGFPPEAAGVADRSALLTRAQWWALAGPLYEGTSGTSGPGEPPASGLGPVEVVSIIGGALAAILASLGINALGGGS